MTVVEQLLKEKLEAHGFVYYEGMGMHPPMGMGGFAANEIIERCKAEAEAEAAAPVDDRESGSNIIPFPTHRIRQ